MIPLESAEGDGLGRAGAKKTKSLTRRLEEGVKNKIGLTVQINCIYGSFSHSITHHRLKIWPLQCTLISKNGNLRKDGYSWIEKDKIRELSSSSILSKTLALIGKI